MCGGLLCKQGDEEQGPSGLEVFFFLRIQFGRGLEAGAPRLFGSV